MCIPDGRQIDIEDLSDWELFSNCEGSFLGYNISMLNLLAIFIGGGIGSLLRYGLTISSVRLFAFPLWGTFTANMIGCLVIGFVGGIISTHSLSLSSATRLFITVGLLGGLTTFSTLNLEAWELIRLGKISWAIGYLLISSFLGLLLASLGYFISTYIS